VALEAYRSANPSELLKFDKTGAQGRVWDGLLTLGAQASGRDPAKIRASLGFLAAQMRENGEERLWLHELPLSLAPASEPWFFSLCLGLGVGLAAGLAFWSAGGLTIGLVAAVVFGLVVAWFGGYLGGYSMTPLGVMTPPISELSNSLVRTVYATSATVFLVAVLGGTVGVLHGLAGVLLGAVLVVMLQAFPFAGHPRKVARLVISA
jgi:hypothetical protein